MKHIKRTSPDTVQIDGQTYKLVKEPETEPAQTHMGPALEMPGYGTRYCTVEVDSFGGVVKGYRWLNDPVDRKRFDAGNVFLTEEAAKQKAANDLLLQRWRIAAAEDWGNEQIDWCNRDRSEYFPYFDHEESRFLVESYATFQETDRPHFRTLEACEKFINENEADLKRLFGVL